MKTSTKENTSLIKSILALFLLAGIAATASAQTLSVTPEAVIKPVSPYTTTVFLNKGQSNSWASGTFVWTLSSTPSGYFGGVTFGTYTQGNSAGDGDVTVTFSGTVVPGNYTFTLTRGSTSLSQTVTVGNIAAANGNADISTFAVDPSNNGNLINASPSDIFNPSANTAALGLDLQGRFYFIPNTSNNGSFTLYGSNTNGSGSTIIDNTGTDLNGISSANLGFVRLAIRDDNTGYVLAADASNVYLANFAANGTTATNVSAAINPVLVGGTVSEFQNGDLCFSADGTMFALANNGAGGTYIYVSAPPYATITKKWTLVGPGGIPFTGSVNGVAFDILGSLYISTSTGLFYIDQNTVNTFGVGTVICASRWLGTGLTDLASNAFPQQTTLPVKWGNFSVTRQNGSALLKWTTLNEVNNDHFEIERSTDGINFSKVGSVNGNGTTSSSNSYQFSDMLNNITVKMVYYRLKDVGYDGKSSYSSIVALRLDGQGGPKNLSVYPNPFINDVKVSMHSSVAQVVTIRISNMAGQQLVQRSHSLQQGENIIIIKELGALKKGVHLLEIISEGDKVTRKIVKD